MRTGSRFRPIRVMVTVVLKAVELGSSITVLVLSFRSLAVGPFRARLISPVIRFFLSFKAAVKVLRSDPSQESRGPQKTTGWSPFVDSTQWVRAAFANRLSGTI